VCGCQCCDGTPLSSTCAPYYPECGGYYPSYTPSIPDCPLNSYYDSLSDSCKCYSGYVASGGQCISADQYCRNRLGFNARYNALTDSCECSYGYVILGSRCIDGDILCHNKHGYNSSYDSSTNSCKCNYGYVFNSSNQCVSEDDYCQNKYGYHSEYDNLRNGCKCKYGYIFNSTMTRCIDADSYCQDKYGYHSSYDSLSKTCECDYGYEFKNGRCVEEEDEIIYFPTMPKLAPKPESQPQPQPRSEPKPKEYNISSPEVQQPKKCDEGYVLSFNKKHCVKIPENAHAVDSPTDLWLCNDGYKEINNTCVPINKEEKPKENQTELSISKNQPKKSNNFVANIWEIASRPKRFHSNNFYSNRGCGGCFSCFWYC